MSIKCYLIGVGGTGCRSIESVVHFAAAGLGPDSMTLGFVDADRGNGNLQRATDLVGLYARLYHSLRREGARNRLDPEIGLFGTEITHEAKDFWSPVPDGADHTLASIFNYAATMPPQEKELFDALFSGQDGCNEKGMRLNEGYRGRPHIGAAVTGARASSTQASFWANIANVVRGPKMGDEVRIFLIGSIFGGTGASGFPTMARKVRHLVEQAGIRDGVKIGGALLLPYFRYPRPDRERHRDAIAADMFLPQAQAALRYYDQMMKASPVFDSLYVLGWPSLIETEISEPGGRGQVNPPMAPELMVATAAMRFFGQQQVPSGKLFVPGWAPNRPFDWSYITFDHDAPDPKRAFGQLLRFCFALQRVYGPYLTQQELTAEVEGHPWFRRLLAEANANMREDSVRRIINEVAEYCGLVMRWAASVNYTSNKSDMEVRLFTAQALASNDKWRDGLAELHPELDPAHEEVFPELIPDTTGSELWQLYDDLTYEPRSDGDGVGVFLSSLYRRCEIDS